MKFARLIVVCLLMLVGLTLFYDWSLNSSLRLIGFETSASQPPPRPIWFNVTLCFVAMLLGITFGSVYESIKNRKTAVNLLKEFVRVTTSPRFSISLLIAPVLFAGVYSATKAEPDLVVATAFAFQNGFFCDRVVRLGAAEAPP